MLAMKKRKFGKGKWNGTGGKLDDGETVEQAAVRETEEEIMVRVKSLEKVAILEFRFLDVPQEKDWDQDVHVYVSGSWEGEPKETEEMKPRWFGINDIPYDSMWEDDKHWLPKVLAGEKVRGEFEFKGKGDLARADVKTVNSLD